MVEPIRPTVSSRHGMQPVARQTRPFIYVPKGRYLVGSLAFKGQCKSPQIIIRIDGTIVAPLDYGVLGKSDNWFSFEDVSGVSIIGRDVQNVHLRGVKIVAAGNSLNTNGIHVQLSRNVEILSTSIKTGDDGISISPSTENLWIEKVTCGLDHGISIGSLAKDLKEEGVQNVTVKNTIFYNTQNGLRIKSWAKPSSGYVQGVQFLGSVMTNVQNPIVID
ncbi:hypothetical protein PVK06_036174 [Gossypium arboreum]|uniref:Polygalacturonase-like n=1 Tax=Gossypium arboreum TaxID=29729 RepID=A0ABR0NIU2_GOSAR|nr:hypothetical protein PVK06_036174 [Gossypium arboreum]